MVCLDRMKEEGTGRTNRHRSGVAGPDWQNPEGLGRVGSPRDHACAELAQQSEVLVRQSEDFECSIGRVGKADQVPAGFARVIGEIGPTIQRWLKPIRKGWEKHTDDEWGNLVSLDLKSSGHWF